MAGGYASDVWSGGVRARVARAGRGMSGWSVLCGSRVVEGRVYVVVEYAEGVLAIVRWTS